MRFRSMPSNGGTGTSAAVELYKLFNLGPQHGGAEGEVLGSHAGVESTHILEEPSPLFSGGEKQGRGNSSLSTCGGLEGVKTRGSSGGF